MLYITYKDNNDHDPKALHELDWHIGQPLRGGVQVLHNVLEVQADGDELAWILERSSNLPQTAGRVQTWFGDHAKFILKNLLGFQAV
jgi:hypothetical protein